MKRSVLLVGVTTVLVGLGVLAAAFGGETPTSPKGDKAPTTQTFTENEWTIITPAGWVRQDVTENADARKAIRYQNSTGEYFVVAIDPLGSDFTYDARWTYVVKGNGFEVTDRYECAGTDDESCTTGDSRYSGWLMWKTGTTPHKVGGHIWYFQFGNSLKTTIDASVFETIAESITVKV